MKNVNYYIRIKINACAPESDDIDMLKSEYKLVIEQIRHYDTQAHYITHFGLALFISSLLAALLAIKGLGLRTLMLMLGLVFLVRIPVTRI